MKCYINARTKSDAGKKMEMLSTLIGKYRHTDILPSLISDAGKHFSLGLQAGSFTTERPQMQQDQGIWQAGKPGTV